MAHMKLLFINPFGTPVYDDVIKKVLAGTTRSDCRLDVDHLKNCPADIDYYSFKHLVEERFIERVVEAERQGYDAVVDGCCYDPGLLEARELVDIPVVGCLEPTMHVASMLGHKFAVITDHHKAVPYLENMVKISGLNSRCTSVRAIEVWIRNIIKEPDIVAPKVLEEAKKIVEAERAEVIVLGCTIVASCFDLEYRKHPTKIRFPILNPVVVASKMAETMVDLRRLGVSTSRLAYFEKPDYSLDEYLDAKRSRY